ncbi:Surfactin synthase thioesterase subunit [Micromonospora sediminicola]|uniref:Surfactin synthase thioesterase subunit n=1 Tax=Micromonospora sediminicola TaxID=946078 RepID=A0A1A9B9N9_9ACTN|nr:alpha/beta fold hydrolase [Micromonospora sediminicola]SBT65689.1 Surfactin synthase thioesterase subunit [Micromonospora sediminicola]
MRQPSTRWLLQEPSSGARPLLFCFPYAGSGASSLRRWPGRIGEIEVHPVQLPGRENRIREEPYRDFETFARDAVRALGPYLDRPYAVIGHCMGALLAHAFTSHAQEVGAPLPERLFVSASLVPARGFYGLYHPWMSDRRIAQELQRVSTELGDGALPEELVSLAARVLRGDVQTCLDHAPPAKWLGVPISAIGWDGDLDVGRDDLSEWRQYGETTEYVLPGDPLSFLAAPSGLRKIVEDDFEC